MLVTIICFSLRHFILQKFAKRLAVFSSIHSLTNYIYYLSFFLLAISHRTL